MSNEDLKTQSAATGTGPASTGSQIAKASDHSPAFTAIDLDTATDLPDLTNAPAMPLELASEYWEPEAPGEVKRMYFSHIEDSLMKDRQNPDELVPVPTAYFFEKRVDSIVMLRNASKLLVGALQNSAVRRGVPVQVIYMGKKKFKNGNTGDSWSVKPLLLEIK